MKKLIILLFVVSLSAGIAYASKYPKYDAELSKIRTVKNAQTHAINNQIKDYALKIEELETNTSMSASQKNEKLREYNAQIDKLSTRKYQIEEKYKADKNRLKILYKH